MALRSHDLFTVITASCLVSFPPPFFFSFFLKLFLATPFGFQDLSALTKN